MDKEQQLPPELQEPLQRLKLEAGRGNQMIRRFFENGEPDDLELLVSWMKNQFLKPMVYGLEEETSKSRLENCIGRLQEQSTRFRELTSAVTNPNQRRFVERWNCEVDAAVSLIRKQLTKLEKSAGS